jgi:hypothetical protein
VLACEKASLSGIGELDRFGVNTTPPPEAEAEGETDSTAGNGWLGGLGLNTEAEEEAEVEEDAGDSWNDSVPWSSGSRILRYTST